MGFTNNRFINKTVVQPSPGGSAVPSSGFSRALSTFGNLFAEQAVKARKKATEADIKHGTQLGRNSIEVDDLGNITRKPMDPSITTKEGQDAFRTKQTNAALQARSNGIRNKSNELAVQYKHHPKSLELYEKYMRAYLGPFLDGTDKDIQAMLEVEAEDVIKKALIGLSQVIEDKEHLEAVEQTNQNITALVSNIGEAEFQGRDSSEYQNSLNTALAAALLAGTKSQSQVNATRKAVNIQVIAGGLFRDAALAKEANLPSIQKKIRERLFGKPGSKEKSEFDKTEGGDKLTNADKELIMQKVNAQFNFIIHNTNQQKKVEDIKAAAMVAPVRLASAAGNIRTMAQLNEYYNSAGISPEMREKSPLLRDAHISLVAKVNEHERDARVKLERKRIADLNTGLLTATDENFAKKWKEVVDAHATGVFQNHPRAYNEMLIRHTSQVKSRIAAARLKSDQGFEDHFRENVFKGIVTGDVLAILMGRGSPDGKPENKAMARWLGKNHGKVTGWIKLYDGGRTKLSQALAALNNGGLNPDEKGKGHADVLIENDQKIAADAGEPNPYDANTPAGREALFIKATEHGIASTQAIGALANLSTSRSVVEAKEAAVSYRRLQASEHGQRILMSIPSKVKARLIELDLYFSPANFGDQLSFDKYLQRQTKAPEYTRRIQDLEKITPTKFQDDMRQTILGAMTKEGDEAGLGPKTLFLYTAYRKFFPAQQTFSEKLIERDAEGDTAWFNHEIAPFGNVLSDYLFAIYKTQRLDFPEGEAGDKAAREETLKVAYTKRLMGPTNYPPVRQLKGDGTFVEENPDHVRFVTRAIEPYFDTPDMVDTLVESALRHALEDDGLDRKSFPPVIGNWFEETLGSYVWSAWPFESLMGSGWIRLQPNMQKTTNTQWVGSIILQDPDDPTKQPFVIVQEWQPHRDTYYAIQEEKFRNKLE